MRKLILILTMGVSFAYAQDTTKWNKATNYGMIFERLKASKVMLLPTDTVYNKYGIATIGNSLFVGNGIKWEAIGADTSSLSNRINLRVKYTDTAAMLNPYLKAAITSLNGLTKSTQYFATGTSGTDFNISSVNDTHTYNIPSASINARGLMTTDTQTFAGAKTFNGSIKLPNFVPLDLSNGARVEGYSGKLLFRTASGTAGYFENNSLYLAAMDNEPNTSNIGVMVKRFDNESKVSYKTPAQIMTYLGALGTTDTATMLSPYIRSAGYGLTKSGQSLLADSLLLSTRAWRQKGLDSLAAIELNVADTSTMLNPYTRGSGTSGQVGYWNGTRSLTGNNNLFWDNANGRLGIGTASPSFNLDVNGTARFQDAITVGTNTFLNKLNASFGTIGIQSYAVNNAWFGDNIVFNSGWKRIAAGFTGLFYFAGNEGQFRWGTNGTAGSSITNGSSGAGLISFKMNVDGTAVMGDLSATQGNYTGASFILFGSSKNIGINTTTDAGFRLDVNGTARINNTLTVNNSSSNQQILVESDRGTGAANASIVEFRNTNATSNKVQFVLGGGSIASGYSRIFAFGTDVTGTGVRDFFIYNGGTANSPFIITPNDRVIIGNSGSSYTDAGFRLDVNGTTRFNGNSTFGTLGEGTGMFWDNTNNRLGILNNAPNSAFQIGSNIAGTAQTKLISVNDITTTDYSNAAFFNSNISTTRLGFVLSNSSSTNWANNHLAILVTGASHPNNNYFTNISGKGNDAGYGMIMGQGSQTTGLLIGTYGTTPVYLGTNNNARLSIFSNGNVGINTTTDAGFRLDVNGTTRLQGGVDVQSTIGRLSVYSTNNSQNSAILLFAKGASGTQSTAGLYYNGNETPASRFFGISADNTNYHLNVYNNGNVSIGTNPSDNGFKLDVNGTARFQDALTVSKNQNSSTILTVSNTTAGTGSQANLTLQSDATAGNGQMFKYSSLRPGYKTINSSDLGFYNSTGGNISILNDVAAGNITFAAGGSSTAHLRIFSNGNVGINQNTDAGYKLDVNGTARVQTSAYFATSSGSVGIGTTAPEVKLDVKGTSTGALTGMALFRDASTNGNGLLVRAGTGRVDLLATWISSGINTDLTFTPTTSGGVQNEVMRVTSAGNVGIGTTSPNASSLLDITSTTQGFLPPRMTTAQRDLIATPAAGLVIYNTSTNKHQGYNGTTWNDFY